MRQTPLSLLILIGSLSFWWHGILFCQQQASNLLQAPGRDTLVERISSLTDPAERQSAVEALVARAERDGPLRLGDSTVVLIYYGPAHHVSVASDLNGWDPAQNPMRQITGTDLFTLHLSIDPAARVEYKFVVDSVWMIDPRNSHRAEGAFGWNSELRMPRYVPPQEITWRDSIGHGTMDTLLIPSATLGGRQPLMVYCPPGYANSQRAYPVLFVLDGGDYLRFGKMNSVMDNLIADHAIESLIGVFLEPRTDTPSGGVDARMNDYALNAQYLRALIQEIRPALRRQYRMEETPARTGIMGASLGGLMATFAAFSEPGIFGLCAAQSPAYWWNHDTLITMIRTFPRRDVVMYIDTGTLRDAQEKARAMREVMWSKGYHVRYAEYPEGHSWGNWRARIGTILKTFWGVH